MIVRSEYRNSIILIALFAVCAVACAADDLWDGSALKPDIASRLQFSLLQQNQTYIEKEPVVQDNTFFSPFMGLRSLGRSLADIATAKQRKRAFIQYAYRDSSMDFKCNANFYMGYDQCLYKQDTYSFLYMGLGVYTKINDNFRIQGDWWNGTFFFDLPTAEQSPLIDGFHRPMGSRIWLDNINGSVSYKNKYVKAALGRGKFQIGNTVSGSIILSDKVNDYDFIAAEGTIGKLKYSFMHGFILADTLITVGGLQRYPEKFVALHQLTYQPSEKLDVFAGEDVVYGNKGMDLSYFLPILFGRLTKHHEFDNDNLLIYCGANYRPNKRLSLYLNYAMDEITFSKIFTNWWGNKYAVQTGASLRFPSRSGDPLLDKRLTLELTAIRPWTYTHYQNHSMYSHDQHPLGYVKGSNLIDLTAELDLPVTQRLSFASQISGTVQGSEGNDWRLNYMDYFSSGLLTQEAQWLQGDKTYSAQILNTLRWNVLAHHSLLIGHRSLFGAEPVHQVLLGWQMNF
jgi:hypothetical protein